MHSGACASRKTQSCQRACWIPPWPAATPPTTPTIDGARGSTNREQISVKAFHTHIHIHTRTHAHSHPYTSHLYTLPPYTLTPLHTPTSTHSRPYTLPPLHTPTPTHSHPYTLPPLHTPIPIHSHPYTLPSLHTPTPTHSHLIHPLPTSRHPVHYKQTTALLQIQLPETTGASLHCLVDALNTAEGELASVTNETLQLGVLWV